jgi:hypothetical protein
MWSECENLGFFEKIARQMGIEVWNRCSGDPAIRRRGSELPKPLVTDRPAGERIQRTSEAPALVFSRVLLMFCGHADVLCRPRERPVIGGRRWHLSMAAVWRKNSKCLKKQNAARPQDAASGIDMPVTAGPRPMLHSLPDCQQLLIRRICEWNDHVQLIHPQAPNTSNSAFSRRCPTQCVSGKGERRFRSRAAASQLIVDDRSRLRRFGPEAGR